MKRKTEPVAGASRADNASHWPTEIRLSKDKRCLHVVFDDGSAVALTAELLRVESPSAEVQGHGEGQKTTPAGKRNVTITQVDPVGHYAVRLTFSDGHATGLYSWDILYDYGQRQDALMNDYLARLAAAGQSRDDVAGL